MLRLVVSDEGFNNDTQEFETIDPVVLELEHSLVSLSKWESKHQKPFLSNDAKTSEEIFDYLKEMIVTPGVDRNNLARCSMEQLKAIQEYIDSPQSATTFGQMPETPGRGEVITAELIYYWMVAFTIPWEAEVWHLNRLFALIRICNIKNSKPQAQSSRSAAAERAKINAERRARLGTRG